MFIAWDNFINLILNYQVPVPLDSTASKSYASDLKQGTLSEGMYALPRAERRLTNFIFKVPPEGAVEINDIATSDFSAAFKGVHVGAIIHIAASLPRRANSEIALKSAIEGSLRILHEAQKAGTKKFVATGSMVTIAQCYRGGHIILP
ncbi:hypothetical protein B0H19DRAFT_1277689 [Mycena capillaripes]|nr:hypothetical protein B0H19DRAFT_1277689 [Mycena capillaripes]